MPLKICFSPHNWHYLDTLQSVIDALAEKAVDYQIVLLEPKNQAFLQYQKKYRQKIVLPFNNSFLKKADQWQKIPFFGLIIKSYLLKNYLQKFLKKKGFSHLVLTADRTYHQLLMIRAANQLKIKPLILFPCEDTITLQRKIKNKAKAMLPLNFKRKLTLWLCQIIYPKNIALYQGKKITMTTPRLVLQLWLLKMLSENPWIAGANHMDLIALSNQDQQKELLQHGIDPKKIRLTGFPEHDRLFLMLKEKQKSKKQLKKFLIIGTHFQEVFKPAEWPIAHQELNNILETTLKELGSKYQIIFKAHPRWPLNEQKQIIKKKLAERIIFLQNEKTVYQLIALADGFLHFGSSAIAGAFCSNEPIFSYCLKNHPSFQEICGHYQSDTKIYNLEQLAQALKRLTSAPLFDKKMMEKRISDRNHFGLFDGQNTQRFIDLLLKNDDY